MNKDTAIIILAVLLILSVGGVAYLSFKGRPVLIGQEAGKEVCDLLPLYSGPTDSSTLFQPYIAQDICRMVFAYEKGDAELCKKMRITEAKGNCYSMLAIKKNDASLCDSAPVDAKDTCYRAAAEKLEGALKLCEKISKVQEKDNCLTNYAGRTGDSAACEKVTDVNNKDNCYMNQAYRDPSLCGKVSNSVRRQECERNTQR